MNPKSIATAFLLALSLAGCLPSSEKRGNAVIYCSEGSPNKLGPQVVSDGTSITASARAVFDRLVEFELGKTTIVPGLAERWEISPNGLEYTFYLRKNVPFHSNDLFTPTRPFNADDVVYSIGRMADPKHPLHQVGGGIYEFYQALGMDKNIKEVQKVGDHKVKIVLKGPHAAFLSQMATHHMSITSKEYGEKLIALGKADLFDMKPVGTGPFVFQKYVKDTLIRYKSFKKHFSKAPAFDELIFSITPDPNVRFQKIKTGECHIVAEPSPADLAAMETHKEIEVIRKSGLNVGYLAMNTGKTPFQDKRIRKAVNMALNKKSYIKAIYFDRATVAKNPIPPTLWSYHEGIKDYAYDPERAKKLLKEAGYPNGFDTDIWVLPVSRPYNPDGKKMGEMMQADLKKVGIRAEIVSYDWGTYLDKSRKDEHSMLQLGWSADYADPENFLSVLLSCASVKSGTNTAKWCHGPFDEAVQKAKVLNSQKEREALYKKAQEIFKEEAPWVTLANATIYRAVRKNIGGYVIDPLGGDHFYSVVIKGKTP
ncbi:MAG: ABC transporter substrate-binding protein [Bacteriovoracales bacterium]|nr:ABC transporter substrate-binding protein [Bacteriovoracales bacterium]